MTISGTRPPTTNRGVRTLHHPSKGSSPDGFEYETEAALDWLTVTTTKRNIGNSMLDIYSRYKAREGRPASFYGFDCLRDETGLTWGQRETDGRYILIAPGQHALPVFRKLTPLPVKVTRIDLACDVWLSDPRDQVRQSSRVPLSVAYEGRIKATYITGKGGNSRRRVGDTLYLGSRSSHQYGRMYDKGLQQKSAPAGKWFRYEVEYKSQGAVQIAKAARGLKPNPLAEWIRCTVYEWFLSRAVSPLFLPDTETPGTTVRAQYKQTTPEKKIAWLRSQVRPTVKYLFEQGLRGETLDALGLELAFVVDEEYNEISGQHRPERIARYNLKQEEVK